MNKAFIKEDDDREPRCPAPEGCGGPGKIVPKATATAQVPDELLGTFSKDILYCANPGCPTAYFDPWGASIPVTALASVTYPKVSTAPVCACFGLVAEDVIEDAERKDPSRIRDLIANAEGPDAACAVKTPDGQCCVPEVRKLFMRHLAGDDD